MSLVPEKVKPSRNTLSVQVDTEVYERLELYAEFRKGAGKPDKGFVVNHMLRYVMDKDRDFAQWLEKRKVPEKLRAVS